MHRRTVAASVAVIVFAGASIASASVATIANSAEVERVAFRVSPPYEPEVAPAERAVIELTELVNLERNRRGLPNLLSQPQVEAAAVAHSIDMADRQEADHFGTDGADTGDRLEREGFDYVIWGEVIGSGYQTPQELFDAWMSSDVHRAHLLSDNFFIGVGVAATPDGVPYWTLVVAS